MAMIALGGGFTFGSLAIHGSRLISMTVLWAMGFLFLGLSEELLLRGYTLFTLATGAFGLRPCSCRPPSARSISSSRVPDATFLPSGGRRGSKRTIAHPALAWALRSLLVVTFFPVTLPPTTSREWKWAALRYPVIHQVSRRFSDGLSIAGE
jgi:hypothetical protein